MTLGHNNGPTMASGIGFRKHCWTRARADLLPKLPIEVIRRRVKRAGELGLDYKSYASIRAASGHDVVAFLFSSNALRLLKANGGLPADRTDKLAALQHCGRLVAVQSTNPAGHAARCRQGGHPAGNHHHRAGSAPYLG